MLTWRPGEGWAKLPGFDDVSGPNGVSTTKDGTGFHVAALSGREPITARFDELPKITRQSVEFPPDNLNWGADGKTILVGGTTATIAEARGCFGSDAVNCPELGGWIDRWDPETGTVNHVLQRGVYGELGAFTFGTRVGDEIWIATFRGNRIGVIPAQ